MYNPLGYKALKTFQQAEEIYSLTKSFCAAYLSPFDDKRLISHMNDSARSIKQNIAEGHGRGSTRANLEFLGFAMGSLTELLEDFFDLEKDYKEEQRKTKKNKEILGAISKMIKLLMGEKTMLEKQRIALQQKYISKGDEKEKLKFQRQNKFKKQLSQKYYQRYWK